MNKRKHSKKHHYVPKGILRHFCHTGQSLYYLANDGKSQEPEPRNIDSVFRRIHYNTYTHPDGTKDDTIERFFASELDNHIPEWIETFKSAILNRRISFKTPKSETRFAQFFYNHYKRTPDFAGPLIEDVRHSTFTETALQEFEATYGPLSEEERTNFFDPKYQGAVLANTRVENFGRQSEQILRILLKMKLVVATPASPLSSFIVASNPVARFEDFPNQKLGNKGVEMWATLTPRIAAGFMALKDAPDTIFLPDSDVEKLNITLTQYSRAIASPVRSQISSLAATVWRSEA